MEIPDTECPSDPRIREAVATLVAQLIAPSLVAAVHVAGQRLTDVIDRATTEGVGDLLAMATRDPACGGEWREVIEAYLCYRAVLGYRIGHLLLRCTSADECRRLQARIAARQLSERVKVETGVEIHPAARIGARFVVDHGVGTVIGETTLIGDDCYVLHGVVFGSTRIADNLSGRRHPTLGSRVSVGAFARVLGPISVGDDVVIGSHALVTQDVPSGSRLRVVHQTEIVYDRAIRMPASLIGSQR